jgi:bifunctional non-homologous end joining protein LigD
VIAGAFDIPVERVILDCEIVVVKDGRTSFSELQAELAKGHQDSLLFYAFPPGAGGLRSEKGAAD